MSERRTSSAEEAAQTLDDGAPPSPERREVLALAGRLACGACVMALASGCEISELRNTGGGGGGDGGAASELAFDLAQAPYDKLASPPALVPVTHNGKKVMLVAISASEIVCLNRACTHQACDMSPELSGIFDGAAGTITCRCHGAAFDLRGVVVQPPATVALKAWPVTYDPATRKGKVTFA